MLAKHALSQLSYGPILGNRRALASARRRFAPQQALRLARDDKASAQQLVGLGGLEPPTSRLSSARSNQLSYKPELPRFSLEETNEVRARPLAKKERRRRRRPANRGLTGRVCSDGTTKQKTSTNRKPELPILPLPFDEVPSRKEVIQPQVPLRLPCYDFTPVADPTVVACLLAVSETPSGKTNSHGVTGGVYKARERIHRGVLIRDY